MPKKTKTAIDRKRKATLMQAAMRARFGLTEVLDDETRTCIHLAEITRRLLDVEGIRAEVVLGGIQATLGADAGGKIQLCYEPLEVSAEWHVWLRVGEWLVDPSLRDLHQQMVNGGLVDPRSYGPISPYNHDVLVIRASRLRQMGDPYRPRDLGGIYDAFLGSPADLQVVEDAGRIASRVKWEPE